MHMVTKEKKKMPINLKTCSFPFCLGITINGSLYILLGAFYLKAPEDPKLAESGEDFSTTKGMALDEFLVF